jgi:hypothetical protein
MLDREGSYACRPRRRVRFSGDRCRDRPYVVVQFRFGEAMPRIPYDKGDVADPARYLGSELWRDLRRICPRIRLRPLYDGVAEDRFRAFIKQAQENDPAVRRLPDFFEFFQLLAPGGVKDHHYFALALRLLREQKRVRDAYVEIPAPLPVVDYANEPGFQGNGVIDKQWHLHPPPAAADAQGGIDAVYAWNLNGGIYDGGTVGFVDVERGWKLDHEDIGRGGQLPIYGVNSSSDAYHGAAVLGVLVGSDLNQKGIVGIAPRANAQVASCVLASGDFNHEAACQAVIAALKPGDIVVIESQIQDAATGAWVPFEWLPSNFNLIKCLTANDLIVIEAGGNGDDNGNCVDFNYNWPNVDDSGAIIVSCAWMGEPGYWPADIPSYAPRGQRVDCFAWGQGIPTCWYYGYGQIDDYYNYFDGTSAATAIVAGAAILLQDAARKRNNGAGPYITPAQMRQILRDPNYTTAAPPGPWIGGMPDLQKLLRALGV